MISPQDVIILVLTTSQICTIPEAQYVGTIDWSPKDASGDVIGASDVSYNDVIDQFPVFSGGWHVFVHGDGESYPGDTGRWRGDHCRE